MRKIVYKGIFFNEDALLKNFLIMNQVFAGGLALIIALILWSSKKQLKGLVFLKSKNDSFSIAQVTSTALINDESSKSQKSIQINNPNSKPCSDQASLSSIETKKKLTKLIASNPNDRLLAIKIACDWESSKALPFLRRGLKDSDSRVVIASAAGILSFKGKTINLHKKSQTSPPPRNVFLMR